MKLSHTVSKITLGILLLAPVAASAQTLIAISKPAKVFDEPNAKGYVTLNQKNEEVHLEPGMAFRTFDEVKGWYLIEYSPGLRGYVSKFRTAEAVPPKAGTYKVANKPDEKITVTLNGDKWSATSGNKKFTGATADNIVYFLDENKKAAYSLVDLGEGPIVMSYDNTLTRFF
jgi:hypothetical protein